jgi:uncharacterized membrane protein
MIETNIENTLARGHIVVSPNLSAQWRTTKLFIWIVSSFALTIGLVFALAGLWLILPFAGIEVLAIVILMYHVARKCHRQQVIYLDEGRIWVEAGYRSPQLAWDDEVFWTRLIVNKANHPWHPDTLILRGRQQQIEIGEFLNAEDKKQLVAQLRPLVSVVD